MFFIGILTASLIGSWHCSAMCGPYATLWNEKLRARKQFAYHIGRLMTYISLTLVFHLFGNIISNALTLPALAIVFLFWSASMLAQSDLFSVRPPQKLLRLCKKVAGGQSLILNFSFGVLTTLIPCAWLYGFVILAAAQSHWASSVLVIFLFWIGTLPSLVLTHKFLVNSKIFLRSRFKTASTILILCLGIWTFWKVTVPFFHSGTTSASHCHLF